MKASRLIAAAIAQALCLCVVEAHSQSPANLLKNPSFEDGIAYWGFGRNGGAKTEFSFDSGMSHSGMKSCLLSSTSPQASMAYGNLSYQLQGLKPGGEYRISLWCKGEAVGVAWFGGGPGWKMRKAFPKGSYDWRELSADFKWPEDDAPEKFELAIVVEGPTKALWIDDVAVVELSAPPPPKGPDKAEIDALAKRCVALKEKLKAEPSLAEDRYIDLGMKVAERFVERLKGNGPKGLQGLTLVDWGKDPHAETNAAKWARLQEKETREVISATEELLDARLKAGGKPIEVPWPASGSVCVKNGLIYAKRPEAGWLSWLWDWSPKEQPCFFAGYVSGRPDDGKLSPFGATLVQREAGPETLSPDLTLPPEKAASIKKIFSDAKESGLKVDFLLSPHYFPAWAFKDAPALGRIEKLNGNAGFIKFDIDHPKARKLVAAWLDAVLPLIKDEPALFSICLSNEPIYYTSGHTPETLPAYQSFLESRHKEISKLNSLYQTNYASFIEVMPPRLQWPDSKLANGKRRALYDWILFNRESFAGWHRWMRDIVKRHAPEVPVHSKIMCWLSLSSDIVNGVDPELFCDLSDMAGNDNAAYIAYQKGELYPPSTEDSYNWIQEELFNDLLHSFGGKPVFNSENHFIPDEAPPKQQAPEHVQAVLWQGALHHQAATTLWVWEEPWFKDLRGSIYLRPVNVFSAGTTMLDMLRCGRELEKINAAPPQAAILYSVPSIYWGDEFEHSNSRYRHAVFMAYRALTLSGVQVAFVSERQLADGKGVPAPWLILPYAEHVSDKAYDRIEKFATDGGKILRIGKASLLYDEYNNPRSLPAKLSATPLISLPVNAKWQRPDEGSNREFATTLREAMSKGGFAFTELTDISSGKSAWGVEYRIVKDGGKTLIPMINFTKKRQTVKLPLKGLCRDLISGKEMPIAELPLLPMTPLLLELIQ